MVGSRILLLLALCLAVGCAGDSAQTETTPGPVPERVDSGASGEGPAIVSDLLDEGELDRAKDVAEAVVKKDPYSAANNLALARAKAAVAVRDEDPREYQEAVVRATFACEAAPDNADAFYTRGRLQFDRRYFGHALRDFQHTLTLEPGNIDSLSMIAWCHSALRQPNKERAAWDALLAVHPDNANGHYRLAMLLIGGSAEERVLAHDNLKESVRLDPGNSLALHALAEAEASQGNLTGSFDLLQRALVASAGHSGREADILFNLGAVSQAQGNLSEARSFYERCLAINLDEYRAITNLGFLLIEQGQVDAGKRRLRQALPLVQTRNVRERIEKVLNEADTGTGVLDSKSEEAGSS